jgi:F-type H+-transporting ATPase subunit epsilon
MYSGQADFLVVPTVTGELGIHARHAPLISILKPGMVRIMLDGEKKHVGYISSGFIEVQPHIVTILADMEIRSEEFDIAAANAARYLNKESETKNKRTVDSVLALQISLYRALEEANKSKRL